MELNIARDDGHALVLLRKSPDVMWVFLALLAPLAIIASKIPTDPSHSMGAVVATVVLVLGMGAIYLKPVYESMTLDRSMRTLVVLRKRLLGSVRKEVRFEQVRAISVKFTDNNYYLALATDDGQIRFPAVAVRIPPAKPNLIMHGEDCAAALRTALGLPAEDPSQTAQGPGGRLIGCSMSVLQRDSDALVMEDRAPSILAMPLLLFVLAMGTMLALNCLDSIPWEITWLVGPLLGAFTLGFMLLYPYKSQYVFDRIGRRMLLLRTSVCRRTSKEISYDQILATQIYLSRGKASRYYLLLITPGLWKINLTPTSYPIGLAAQCHNCAIIEGMVKEALGRDRPATGEPHDERAAELEVAGDSRGNPY